jgi:transposase-like protein
VVSSPKKESSYEREKRNKFTAQFKAKVALEAIRSDKTLNEIGSEFGVHASQVGLWKRELLENAPGIFYKKRGLKPVDLSSDPEMLYTEISRLMFVGLV